MKTYGWWIVGALIVIGGIGWFGWKVATAPVIPEDDVVAASGIHWHAKLDIRVEGELIPIPAEIGLGGVAPGAHPHNMHTHDPDHIIHIEKTGIVVRDDLKLSHFFEVWGKQFTPQCIFEHCNGSDGTVKMKVNGQDNTEFGNFVMHDMDKIEIVFE